MLFGHFGRVGRVHMINLHSRLNLERQILFQQFKNVLLVDCIISNVAEKSFFAVVGNEILFVDEIVAPTDEFAQSSHDKRHVEFFRQ